MMPGDNDNVIAPPDGVALPEGMGEEMADPSSVAASIGGAASTGGTAASTGGGGDNAVPTAAVQAADRAGSAADVATVDPLDAIDERFSGQDQSNVVGPEEWMDERDEERTEGGGIRDGDVASTGSAEPPSPSAAETTEATAEGGGIRDGDVASTGSAEPPSPSAATPAEAEERAPAPPAEPPRAAGWSVRYGEQELQLPEKALAALARYPDVAGKFYEAFAEAKTPEEAHRNLVRAFEERYAQPKTPLAGEPLTLEELQQAKLAELIEKNDLDPEAPPDWALRTAKSEARLDFIEQQSHEAQAREAQAREAQAREAQAREADQNTRRWVANVQKQIEEIGFGKAAATLTRGADGRAHPFVQWASDLTARLIIEEGMPGEQAVRAAARQIESALTNYSTTLALTRGTRTPPVAHGGAERAPSPRRGPAPMPGEVGWQHNVRQMVTQIGEDSKRGGLGVL